MNEPLQVPEAGAGYQSYPVFEHLKTGNHYIVLVDNACDCTNARDGNSVVIYKHISAGEPQRHVFVRDRTEFQSKFKSTGTVMVIATAKTIQYLSTAKDTDTRTQEQGE